MDCGLGFRALEFRALGKSLNDEQTDEQILRRVPVARVISSLPKGRPPSTY